MLTIVLLAMAGSLVLASAHVVAPLLLRIPVRSQTLLASFAGGVGLAYVFLYLLFELASEGAAKLHAAFPLGPEPLETLFILLLGAFVAVYLLVTHLQLSPDLRDDHRGYAWFFLAYNMLAGAALLEEAYWGPLNLGFYVLALSLHMLFNDHFLHQLSPENHTWGWRAALASAPVIGCALAAGLNLSDALLYGMLTVIAGGTIVNVLRREVPEPQNLRPLAFLAGVLGYALLIMANWRF